MFDAPAVRKNSRVRFPQHWGWMGVGIVIIATFFWKIAPLMTAYAHQAEGYEYLTQALEILGAQNPGPDYCVVGGISEARSAKIVIQATEALNLAHKARPSSTQTLLMLGRAYCLSGRLEEAAEVYKAYTELRPDNPLGHLELGFAYQILSKHTLAISEWQKAYITPEHFINIGNQKRLEGNIQLARIWYERSIMLDPDSPEGWYWVGFVKEQENDLLGALEAFQKSVTLDPSKAANYYEMAHIFKAINDLPNALQYYQKASQLDALPVEAYVEIGQIEEKLGNPEKALAAYQHAAQLGELIHGNLREDIWKRAWPHYLLGNFYLQFERLPEAKVSYEIALSEDPKNLFSVWSLWGLGRIEVSRERYDEALAYLNQALELELTSYLRSQVYFQIGVAYQGQGDIRLGLEYLSMAHQEDPENKGLHLFYANALIESDHLQEGIDEYKIYLVQWPNDLTVQNRLLELEQLINPSSQP
jgi:tetratricopeptide (TPR) repeat protein